MIAPTYTRLINIVYNLAAHIIVEKEEKKNDFFLSTTTTARCIIIRLYYSCCIVVVCVVSRISKLYIKMIVVLLFLSLSLSLLFSLSLSLILSQEMMFTSPVSCQSLCLSARRLRSSTSFPSSSTRRSTIARNHRKRCLPPWISRTR